MSVPALHHYPIQQDGMPPYRKQDKEHIPDRAYQLMRSFLDAYQHFLSGKKTRPFQNN
jgi:hypothetical protein